MPLGPIDRRAFLKGAGVTLALPFLETAPARAAAKPKSPQRKLPKPIPGRQAFANLHARGKSDDLKPAWYAEFDPANIDIPLPGQQRGRIHHISVKIQMPNRANSQGIGPIAEFSLNGGSGPSLVHIVQRFDLARLTPFEDGHSHIWGPAEPFLAQIDPLHYLQGTLQHIESQHPSWRALTIRSGHDSVNYILRQPIMRPTDV